MPATLGLLVDDQVSHTKLVKKKGKDHSDRNAPDTDKLYVPLGRPVSLVRESGVRCSSFDLNVAYTDNIRPFLTLCRYECGKTRRRTWHRYRIECRECAYHFIG